MSKFQLKSDYQPTGDQPTAIAQLTAGVQDGLHNQTLLGVTGSGKTFTMANVIQNVQKPTLVLSHNKTLAAQLYEEFKRVMSLTRLPQANCRHQFWHRLARDEMVSYRHLGSAKCVTKNTFCDPHMPITYHFISGGKTKQSPIS